MNMYGNHMPNQGVQGAMQGNMPNQAVQGAMQGNMPNQAVQGAMMGNMPNQAVQGAMQGNMPNQAVQGAMQGNMPNQAVQGAMQGNMPNQAVQGAMMHGKEKELKGDMKKLCNRYSQYHAKVKMQDGMEYEGILMDSDDEHMSMMIPQEVEEDEGPDMNRQYGRYRYRRFGRFFFPLAGIAALSLIPYYRPYPYYPYYGYPPYYY
ncbi:hypothetical protein [Pseudalkalibacillus hwajinpoensis]|uniref:Uncharacterized protein n=1 Tax=Guptibacillus hwajinpoensis TaxID=208199 RepID=A0A4U1MDF7_9BACL|nr:hypothetical protein [Pseudalkalibacillus hwajinpoensis]TKD68773.1 hypothetical protein FBF83_16365 [Pseudalkalibacillus hwajinpoensis]